MRSLRQTFSRVLWGAVLALGLAQPAMTRAQSAKLDPDDALLFDVRLGQYRLGEGVRGYRTPAGTCIDLADTIIALDIPVRLDKKLRRATGWAFAESRTIAIDREAATVQIMNTSTNLAANDIFDTPEGWCVRTAKLADWLGVGLDADEANALLVIQSKSKLPVELQIERRARAAKVRSVASFDLGSLPQAQARFGRVQLPAIDAVVSLGGIKQGSRNAARSEFNRSYEIYAAGEVGPIAYNARLSSDRRGAPESLRVQGYRTDPAGQLLGPLKATHVAAGDVSGYSTALVSQSAIGRGAMITNRPVERRDSFDRTDFRGELPAGWDAELYRNGQLLAFATNRADGRYEFLDVALLYGQNRFEVVLYGPQGQVRRELKTVRVGLDSIPPRKTYYWAGFLDEGRDLIGGLGSANRFGRTGLRGTFGLERGLNAKTSLAALGHSLMLEDGERRSYGEIALRRAVGPTLVELSAAQAVEGGTALRAQMLGEFGKTYVSAESIVARGGFESDRVLRDVTGLHSVSVDHAFALGRSFLPVHFDARYTTRATGNDALEATSRVSTGIGRMSLTNELSWRSERRRFGPDPDDIVEGALLANARMGRIRLRGEARYRLAPQTRFDGVSLIGEWSGGKDDRSPNDWRAEIGYDRSLHRARAGIGYIRRFEKVALTASLEGGTDGSVAAGLNLAFSLGPDPRGNGIRVTSTRLATQGQAVALVYRDLNGDKIRQPDEPVEKDVQLAAGRVPVNRLTGADGQVIVDSLEPFQPVLIGIDASSLPDPLVQPASPGVVVTPRPGVAVAIELPLSAAGEIDGTLTRNGGGNLEGVDLELVDAEGRAVMKTRSEYDGFFLFEAVPYGRYTIRVAKLSAEAARLAVPLIGGVIVSGDAPSVHMGVVAARPSELQAKAEGP